jgi:hypothetical protein
MASQKGQQAKLKQNHCAHCIIESSLTIYRIKLNTMFVVNDKKIINRQRFKPQPIKIYFSTQPKKIKKTIAI